MTREIDNALLMHGGTDEIDIPGAALQKIISDAPSRIATTRLQRCGCRTRHWKQTPTKRGRSTA